MRKCFIVVLLLSTVALSDPVSCNMLEEGRAAKGNGCKCAVRVYKDEIHKARAVVGYCGANLATFVLDIMYEGRWYKSNGTICEKMQEIKRWSCKTYNYLQEDWFSKADLKTMSYAEFRNGFEDLLDPGDMEYLGLKLGY